MENISNSLNSFILFNGLNELTELMNLWIECLKKNIQWKTASGIWEPQE